jgi:hypothetical protein
MMTTAKLVTPGWCAATVMCTVMSRREAGSRTCIPVVLVVVMVVLPTSVFAVVVRI